MFLFPGGRADKYAYKAAGEDVAGEDTLSEPSIAQVGH